jgi:uncharacterized glyoxalase superfamily protein PhnB
MSTAQGAAAATGFVNARAAVAPPVSRAVEAGATLKEPVTLKWYGNRTGRIIDPFDNEWLISTRVEDVSDEEMRRRFEAMTRR